MEEKAKLTNEFVCACMCVCVCAKLDSNQFNNMLRDKTLFCTVIMSA